MAHGRYITHFSRIIIGLLLILTGCTESGNNQDAMIETVDISGNTFHLEVVADDETRSQGLQGRTSIAEDGGMLFIFPESQIRSFWMGHCLVDMDVIFLNHRGRITAVHRMKTTPPQGEDESDYSYQSRMPHYWSNSPAQFAIEVKSGWLDRLDLHLDDRIELDLDRLKALAQ